MHPNDHLHSFVFSFPYLLTNATWHFYFYFGSCVFYFFRPTEPKFFLTTNNFIDHAAILHIRPSKKSVLQIGPTTRMQQLQ
jgi:hypothetical protein